LEQRVAVAINGNSVHEFTTGEAWTKTEFVVPRLMLHRGINEMILRYEHTLRPSETGRSTDDRALAIQLRDIDILPADRSH
jgi:hypothetical protein